MKFKTGDRVRKIEGNHGMAALTGAMATVTAYPDPSLGEGYIVVKWDDDAKRNGQSHGNYSIKAFEQVKEEYMFKVGDNVRCVKHHDGRLPQGIGTVLNVNQWTIRCRFPEWKGGHGDGSHEWNFHPEVGGDKCLVLVEQPEKVLTLNRERVVSLCRLLANAGKKIDAIRLWREFSGEGLKEAKDFVEGGCIETFKAGDVVIPEGSERKATIIAGPVQGCYWVRRDGGEQPVTYFATSLKAA